MLDAIMMFGVKFRFRESLPRVLLLMSFHFFKSVSTSVLSPTVHIHIQPHLIFGLCISWANTFESLIPSHEKTTAPIGRY